MFEKYYQVSQLSEAVELLSSNPGKLKIIAGGTDLWLEYKNNIHKNLEGFIDISRIIGLDQITIDDTDRIHLGALVTHAHCVRSEIIKEYAPVLYQACKSVGSPQIRNRGTVAGNLITGSPANDTICALMALDAVIVAKSKVGEREIPVEKLYTGVRKTVIRENEIIADIWFTQLDPAKTVSIFVKQGLRKAQAISLLNLSIVCATDGNGIISDLRIAFGALAPTVVRARNAEGLARGIIVNELDSARIAKRAVENISPITDIRSTEVYRRRMAETLLIRQLDLIKDGMPSGSENPRDVTLWGKQKNPYKPIEKTAYSNPGSLVEFTLNGKPASVVCVPGRTALDAIRDQDGHTGSKEGCGEGECGACTIFMDGIAVLACLIPVQRLAGTRIETIESLSNGREINPVQKAFIEENAVQCGFCTPGFIMSATKLIEEVKNPNGEEIKIAISGNLCRCTGYYKIIRAIEKAAEMS